MNKKGFTLIELIVAIAILGVISALSFSTARSLQDKNKQRKFEEYGNSLIEAAKLYVDSYSEDMFTGETGCQFITFEELQNKIKIKDFQQKGISCNNDKTRVMVKKTTVKINGTKKYDYKVNLKCKQDGKTIYEEISNNCP